ncbi:hypothetical protein V1478_010927 [Vespula squamosa]|uniref:Uncharacterized protein n=1 Tax=Vespula squamosa TaxID=30214 RepID=A0ABD2AII4_VESSQ
MARINRFKLGRPATVEGLIAIGIPYTGCFTMKSSTLLPQRPVACSAGIRASTNQKQGLILKRKISPLPACTRTPCATIPPDIAGLRATGGGITFKSDLAEGSHRTALITTTLLTLHEIRTNQIVQETNTDRVCSYRNFIGIVLKLSTTSRWRLVRPAAAIQVSRAARSRILRRRVYTHTRTQSRSFFREATLVLSTPARPQFSFHWVCSIPSSRSPPPRPPSPSPSPP